MFRLLFRMRIDAGAKSQLSTLFPVLAVATFSDLVVCTTGWYGPARGYFRNTWSAIPSGSSSTMSPCHYGGPGGGHSMFVSSVTRGEDYE